MAHIVVEINPCDVGGPYGTTSYYCSECYHSMPDTSAKKCPKCGVEFDEDSKLKTHPGFGGHDFL
jgi:hypothetical protein